jgi:translation initiation factor 3 subunit M
MGSCTHITSQVVNSSEYFTFEAYTDMQCFQHLKSKPDTAGLLELCELFSSGTLDQYSAFVAKNGGVFSKLGVNEEECLRKMRLLTICTVGDGVQEVPYSTIQKALNMPEDQVERWVIKAISAKLVDAKMDQLRKVVLFS